MLVRAMVLDWGMSDKLGFVKYSPDSSKETFINEKPYSDETAAVIDNEIRRINDEAYHEATFEIHVHCTAPGGKQTWDEPSYPAEFEVTHVYYGPRFTRLLTYPQLCEMISEDMADKMIEAATLEAIETGDF